MDTYRAHYDNPDYWDKLVDRVDRIRSASQDDLLNVDMMRACIEGIGLHDTPHRSEYGSAQRFINPGGPGLCQIPDQFAALLVALSCLRIKKVVEIGVSAGWTHSILMAYLSVFNPEIQSILIDPEMKFNAFEEIQKRFPMNFWIERSEDAPEITDADLCFIDGVHDSAHIKNDWERFGRWSRFVLFHDIRMHTCPDVGVFWENLKAENNKEGNHWACYEFVEDPDNRTNIMGLGLAIKATTHLRCPRDDYQMDGFKKGLNVLEAHTVIPHKPVRLFP